MFLFCLYKIQKLESIQKGCLKIILGDEYHSYNEALNYCSLETLESRRENHMKKFSLRCINDEFNFKMFPKNTTKNKDKYQVNFARTAQYLNSAIPQCQRLLNTILK